MMDLNDLYQEVILDHNRHPKNARAIECPTCEAKGVNPLCGDQLTVYLKVVEDAIEDISFMGRGCAISQASASLMTEVLKGKTVEDALALFNDFHRMLTENNFEGERPTLGKLSALAGVRSYPARVKCATLAWHTLDAALKKEPVIIIEE